jgi:hypothetical protein
MAKFANTVRIKLSVLNTIHRAEIMRATMMRPEQTQVVYNIILER